MDVEEIALPGIGLRYDFATRSGRHVGVICHRGGRRDLVVYDRDDPDSSREVLQLTDRCTPARVPTSASGPATSSWWSGREGAPPPSPICWPEYTAPELVGNLRAQAAGGVVDLVLNAAPGALAGVLLGWSPVAVLAMAGVTYASSSGIVAKVLADLGRLDNRETPVVLSLLVLEDLVMALYLPVLTGMLARLGLVRGGISVTVALTTVAVVLVVALRFGDRISRIMFDENDEVLLLRVLGLALLVAGIAARLQVSAAVGAFLVGIALSGEVAESARALLTPLRDLFAAVFFVFFGLHTDPGQIPGVAGVAVLLGLVGIATKVGTGCWAARRIGIRTIGRFRAGGALVPRGEFTIVIAGLAVTAGVEPDIGPLAAAYVVFLVVTGPFLARYVEPAARAHVRRRSARARLATGD